MCPAQTDANPADGVLEQVKANLSLIKSVEFSFHVRNKTFRPPLGSGYDEHEWDGRFLLDNTGRFRQEFEPKGQSKTIIDAADADGTRRVLSHHQTADAYTASIFKRTNAAMWQDGPAIGSFLPAVWFSAVRANAGWKLRKGDKELILETEFLDSSPTSKYSYHVDSNRSYIVTSSESKTKYYNAPTANPKYDQYVGTMRLEHAEIRPGIWFPIKGDYRQEIDGILTDERSLVVDRESIQVNQPVDVARYVVTFPKGCRVVDQIGKLEYVVGGDSRGQANAEALVQQANAIKSTVPAEHPAPAAGALAAVTGSRTRLAWLIGGLILATSLSAIAVRRWRR